MGKWKGEKASQAKPSSLPPGMAGAGILLLFRDGVTSPTYTTPIVTYILCTALDNIADISFTDTSCTHPLRTGNSPYPDTHTHLSSRTLRLRAWPHHPTKRMQAFMTSIFCRTKPDVSSSTSSSSTSVTVKPLLPPIPITINSVITTAGAYIRLHAAMHAQCRN